MKGAGAAALLLLAGVLPLPAQTVRGRVVDAASGEEVRQARVTLLGADQRVVTRGTSNAAGTFTLHARLAGSYRVAVERTGYRRTLTQPIELGARDTVEVDVLVSAEALQMEPLTVRARKGPRRIPALDAVGFYARERSGFGRFLHRDDLEGRANMSLAQALDRLPGTTLIGNGSGEVIVFDRSSTAGALLRMQMGRPPLCLPEVYLDGVLMAPSPLSAIIHPEHVEAVEVYSGPAHLPPQFNGSRAACGVIVIWSRVQP